MKQENAIYENESTVYENEDTVYDNSRVNAAEGENNENATAETLAEEKETTPAAKKGMAWKSASVGAGTGILLGTVASFVTTNAIADDGGSAHAEGIIDEGDSQADVSSQPAWADDEVSVATSVNDDMSFSEAFAAARAEVGSGGAFEWRGGVYGTYTADEWNNMSAEERAEYNEHFSWSSHTSTSSASAETAEAVTDDSGDDVTPSDDMTPGNDENDVNPDNGENGGETIANNDPAETIDVIESTPEIEILGVSYDEELDVNVGNMTIDGEEVVLIDVDGGDFDYLVADLDHNQQITEDEIFDISDRGISVEGFAAAALGDSSLYASNDGTTDYINDGHDLA